LRRADRLISAKETMKRINGIWQVRINKRWIEAGDLTTAFAMLNEAYWGIK
jgi:hypothetical protein